MVCAETRTFLIRRSSYGANQQIRPKGNSSLFVKLAQTSVVGGHPPNMLLFGASQVFQSNNINEVQ